MTLQRRWGTIAVALVAGYLLFSGNRGLWNLYKLHEEKRILQGQVGQLRAEIGHNQAEYQDFERNTRTLEKQAREELNLVKPGEIVYKFPRDRSR